VFDITPLISSFYLLIFMFSEAKYDVMTFLIAGPQFWPLPSVELEYEACINQLKLFAQFLLEGTVFSRLKPFVKHLLSPASLVTKQWAQ